MHHSIEIIVCAAIFFQQARSFNPERGSTVIATIKYSYQLNTKPNAFTKFCSIHDATSNFCMDLYFHRIMCY